MAELPAPPEGIVLAHFIVSDDVERSRRFYTEVLGGRVAFSGPGGLTYVALANSWIIINAGGGPTDDKPAVTLETPRDPDRVSSFLNIRVRDIAAVYAEWSARGAQFLTPPKQHQYEIRCYVRDPDGHLIEVGQTTDPEGYWSPAHWPPSTRAGDLVYHGVQHGKPQREDHGIGALQRVAVAGGDDRSATDRRSQLSRRLDVGAREPQGLAAGGELAGDGRSDPSRADDRGGHPDPSAAVDGQ